MKKPVFYTPSFNSDMANTSDTGAFDLQSFDVIKELRPIVAGNQNITDDAEAIPAQPASK